MKDNGPVDRAGPAPRLAAAFFDAVAIFAVLVTEYVVLASLFLAWAVVSPQADEARRIDVGWQIGFAVFVNLLLLGFTALEIFIGKSFGKLVVGIRILAADGSRAATGALAARWLIKHSFLIVILLGIVPASLQRQQPIATMNVLWVVAGVLFVLVLACFLFVLGPSRQALYDRWTGTMVVRRIIPGDPGLATLD
jgi:uncharacterized RDD family membrane protein YckC